MVLVNSNHGFRSFFYGFPTYENLNLELAAVNVARLTPRQYIYLIGAKTEQDAKLLDKISLCESGRRQFNTNGSVLRGRVNSKDIGYFQINEYYNGKTCRDLGYDIYTTRGNIDCALYLFYSTPNGKGHWNASRSCWGK